MTYPARAEIKYPPFLRQCSGIVLAEKRYRIVINMGDEAGRGVEVCVWGFVLPAEVTGSIREGGVSSLILGGREVGREQGGGSHGGEEGGDRQ